MRLILELQSSHWPPKLNPSSVKDYKLLSLLWL